MDNIMYWAAAACASAYGLVIYLTWRTRERILIQQEDALERLIERREARRK
jgi:hypothetical protein